MTTWLFVALSVFCAWKEPNIYYEPPPGPELTSMHMDRLRDFRKRPVKHRCLGRGAAGRRSGFEGGFPAVGEEVAEVGRGIGGDAQEDVAQVGEGVDAVAFGALDEGEVDGGGAASAV